MPDIKNNAGANHGNHPFFSVIMPCHNAASYFKKGLHSIRYQTFKDYELICICDACTDNTAQIALNYADRVICTSHANDGLARNAGLDVASGEWILFIDDDDWFLHEYVFQMIHDVVGRNNEDMLLFGFIWKTQGYAVNRQDKVWIAVWNKCWRRTFIGDTRFPNIQYYSDKYFHEQMMQKGPRAVFWDMPLYYYNFLRPGSLSKELKDKGVLYQEVNYQDDNDHEVNYNE